MSFKDHFSRQSAAYSRYRPAYPPALIEFVVRHAPARRLAVDCATGSGQAAVALAEHFAAVLAVDASSSQLTRAQPHPRVHYAASLAERLPAPDGRADLVTAAQAAHWFDFERFHAECRRVLAPGGVVAVWTYEKFHVNDAVDAVIDDFYTRVVGSDWPPERRYVELGYRTLRHVVGGAALQGPARVRSSRGAAAAACGALATVRRAAPSLADPPACREGLIPSCRAAVRPGLVISTACPIMRA